MVISRCEEEDKEEDMEGIPDKKEKDIGESLVARVAQSVAKMQNPALRQELTGLIAPVDQVLAQNSPYVKQMKHRRRSQTSK